jgi:putative NADH-flavin reductase
MHILVIGGSRGIGLDCVRHALDRGHVVRAFARSAQSIPLEHERLDKRTGDATRPDDVGAALDGVEAVILALGVPRTASALLRPVHLFSEATAVLVPAMEERGIRRLLAVTGFGAGDSYARVSSAERIAFQAIMGRAYADKTRQEALIMDSGLDWTIARPGILTSNRGTGRYQVLTEPATWRNGVIARADVAHFLIHAAEDGTFIREAPVLVR